MENLIEIHRGDSKDLTISATIDGAKFDVSDYTVNFIVKADKESSNDYAIIGPIEGTLPGGTDTSLMVFALSSELTTVKAGTYFYEVEGQDVEDIKTLAEGLIVIQQDVYNDSTTEPATLYITPDELRMFLQFDVDDYPTTNDLIFFIKTAMRKVGLDIETGNEDILFLATLLLSKTFVLRGLASKSVKTGYIQVNAEGRTITKAYQEFVLDAENSYQEYKEFILSTSRREITSTNFMENNMVSSWTRADIINLMNGTSNAMDTQRGYRYSYFWRRRA